MLTFYEKTQTVLNVITMKELISELSVIECSLLLVSTAIIVAVAFVLIVSRFDND